jgi:predicted  nucleic acid-binding Zn-ribbon protein
MVYVTYGDLDHRPVNDDGDAEKVKMRRELEELKAALFACEAEKAKMELELEDVNRRLHGVSGLLQAECEQCHKQENELVMAKAAGAMWQARFYAEMLKLRKAWELLSKHLPLCPSTCTADRAQASGHKLMLFVCDCACVM